MNFLTILNVNRFSEISPIGIDSPISFGGEVDEDLKVSKISKTVFSNAEMDSSMGRASRKKSFDGVENQRSGKKSRVFEASLKKVQETGQRVICQTFGRSHVFVYLTSNPEVSREMIKIFLNEFGPFLPKNPFLEWGSRFPRNVVEGSQELLIQFFLAQGKKISQDGLNAALDWIQSEYWNNYSDLLVKTEITEDERKLIVHFMEKGYTSDHISRVISQYNSTAYENKNKYVVYERPFLYRSWLQIEEFALRILEEREAQMFASFGDFNELNVEADFPDEEDFFSGLEKFVESQATESPLVQESKTIDLAQEMMEGFLKTQKQEFPKNPFDKADQIAFEGVLESSRSFFSNFFVCKGSFLAEEVWPRLKDWVKREYWNMYSPNVAWTDEFTVNEAKLILLFKKKGDSAELISKKVYLSNCEAYQQNMEVDIYKRPGFYRSWLVIEELTVEMLESFIASRLNQKVVEQEDSFEDPNEVNVEAGFLDEESFFSGLEKYVEAQAQVNANSFMQENKFSKVFQKMMKGFLKMQQGKLPKNPFNEADLVAFEGLLESSRGFLSNFFVCKGSFLAEESWLKLKDWVKKEYWNKYCSWIVQEDYSINELLVIKRFRECDLFKDIAEELYKLNCQFYKTGGKEGVKVYESSFLYRPWKRMTHLTEQVVNQKLETLLKK